MEVPITNKHRVLVVGAGPAGLTAAIYLGRAGLDPLLAAGGVRQQLLPGGQLNITTDVENFPGFNDGVSGPELVEKMMDQAKKSGATIVEEWATDFRFSLDGGHHKVKVGDKDMEFEAIILAMGAAARWLGLDREQYFYNKGLSACAVCDGPLPIYRNQHLYVVGGGDSAMEEALFLTRFASKVSILHRTSKLRASRIMVQKAKKNPKIEFLYDTEVIEYIGTDKLERIKIRNTKTLNEKIVDCIGLFLAIGHTPMTEELKNTELELDPQGYIVTYDVYGQRTDGVRTNIKGVLTAGDVHDRNYRQAITAAGYGCQAALVCQHYLQ